MEIVYKTHPLYRRRADGAYQYWQGFVYVLRRSAYSLEDQYFLSTSYKNGINGSETESDPKLIQGKNKGKSNETTPYQQAIIELDSRCNKKFDQGYTIEGNELPTVIYPMLAQKFNSNKVIFPCVIQPKLDGCRAIYIPDRNVLRSRQQKVFENLDHITDELKGVNLILDGELMLPSEYSFQDTISAIKRKNENTELLQYHVYDVVMNNQNYTHRWRYLEDLFHNNKFSNIELILKTTVCNSQEIQDYHLWFKEGGFEGSIIRNLDYPYEQNKRSPGLLKLKDILSDEFEIVDVKYDNRNAAYFVCNKNNPNAKTPTFEVCPTGSLDNRKTKDYRKFIGKWATVNYYDLTDDFAPKFANLIAIRDYE